MGKKAKARSDKQRRKEQKRAEKEARAAAERAAAQRRKWVLAGILLVTVGVAVSNQLLGGPRIALGATLLVGTAAFLAVALGALGASVKPRDRTKASNIDYGN
ncbi:MAG: hypothetical protein OXR73_37930 [Myxococcales bacterium]|nr:hypothetical protein [Myxococcales bacterium]